MLFLRTCRLDRQITSWYVRDENEFSGNFRGTENYFGNNRCAVFRTLGCAPVLPIL